MSAFSDTTETLSVENKEVLLLGDFNCDFSAKKTTQPDCKQMKCLFKSLNSPTRITTESSTLTDLIATNNPHNIRSSGVLSSGLSDHELVYCVRKLNWMRFPYEMKTFRNYVNYDQHKFCKDPSDVDWESVVKTKESSGNVNGSSIVNDRWTSFKGSFVSIVDKHAPLITKKARGFTCPWINRSIHITVKHQTS